MSVFSKIKLYLSKKNHYFLKKVLIIFFLFLLIPNELFAKDFVKINLFAKHKIEKIEIYTQKYDKNRLIIKKNEKITLQNPTWIEIVNSKNSVVKKYISGELDIKKVDRYWRIYLTIPLKEYIIDVLLAELGSNLIQKEALKAFYLVVKSYTKYQLKNSRHKGFDFCDIAHCQLYNGMNPKRDLVKNIIKDIENLEITYENRVILAVFNSSCSLYSSSAKEIWGEDIPYLQSQKNYIYDICNSDKNLKNTLTINKKDNNDNNDSNISILNESEIINKNYYDISGTICDLDGKNRNFRWSLKITKKDFKKIFKNQIKNFELNENGYPTNIIIGDKTYTLENFRREIASVYGWGALKSNQFNPIDMDDFYLFVGGGFGHGVGFCILEGVIMGEMGYNFKQIIKHFYKNIQITVEK